MANTVSRHSHTALLVAIILSIAPGSLSASAPPGDYAELAASNLDSAYFTGRIILKFSDDTAVRLRDGRLIALNGAGLGQVRDILRSRHILKAERLFTRDEAKLDHERAIGMNRTGRTLADLNNFYRLHLAQNTSSRDAQQLLRRLNACDSVEIAYPETEPVDATVTFTKRTDPARPLMPTPDFSHLQGYLYDPPYGVNGVLARGYIGGDGLGAFAIDVERDWNETHEDLPEFFFADFPTPRQQDNDHGTAVLGEIAGVDNGYGVIGLSVATRVGGVSWYNQGVANAINVAAAAMDPGGAILLEIQYVAWTGANPYRLFPIEWDPAVFAAIQAATAIDRVVVEAAGNGSEDLDDPWFGGYFDRTIQDSGAIMCAASGSDHLYAMWYTNYGSRIDIHAWGEDVTTCGYGDLYSGQNKNQWYTDSFSGTSSASPMATAGVAILQGICAQHGQGPVEPLEVRRILNDTGTPHQDPTKEIGPRVNCAAATSELSFPIGLVPLSAEIITGRLFDGETEDLLDSDNDYFITDSRRVPTSPLNTYATVQVGARIHAAPLARLDLTIESSNLLVDATQETKLYNYATDGFDVLDTSLIGFGDTVVVVENIANPNDYLDPETGEMLVEVQNGAPASSATALFRNRLDQVRLTVTYQ